MGGGGIWGGGHRKEIKQGKGVLHYLLAPSPSQPTFSPRPCSLSHYALPSPPPSRPPPQDTTADAELTVSWRIKVSTGTPAFAPPADPGRWVWIIKTRGRIFSQVFFPGAGGWAGRGKMGGKIRRFCCCCSRTYCDQFLGHWVYRGQYGALG